MDQLFKHAHDREYTQSKARQKQKLQRLLQKKADKETNMDLSGTQLKKWVINLSKRETVKSLLFLFVGHIVETAVGGCRTGLEASIVLVR